VPKRQPPEIPATDQRIERRRQPRDARVPVDWEQIVLQRMASRVKALAGNETGAADAAATDGWERSVVQQLHRRMRELEPKK